MYAERPGAVDVVIAGGGPAACAVALTLRRYTGLSVMLVEQSGYEHSKVGETLSPGVLPLLDYLGVGEAFRDAGFSPSYAFTAAWGDDQVRARDFLFTGRGHGWHLDRRRFDAGLANAARSFGAQLLLKARLRDICREQEGWCLTASLEDGELPLRCGYLIDATGRSAWLARAVGAKKLRHDRLVGVATYHAASTVPVEACSLVESVPQGWWYSAPVPDGRVVSVLMTDSDLLQENHASRFAFWQAALDRAPQTRARIGGREAEEPLRIWPAHSQSLVPCCGPGWAAAGDAAAAFDPLSSMGIGYALSTGIQAARLAAAHFADGSGEALQRQAYGDDIGRHIDEYLTLKRGYYQAEGRFAEEQFWARRRAGEES
ncbi:tryptophan 7-halogenase [Metapseudomonas boanensis]|uniref:Tryptophan 7-halogenase n=1 Tax=Metapseudomonas boanensis TaxID=2822138 RepID=A0ABS5XIB5_9GAMM|nr:tryptophan 7-halogenase [Pseudomonas boanensis]MBT8767427.1 tryptophan 7-halogenase [Pseudomonas boanensis]